MSQEDLRWASRQYVASAFEGVLLAVFAAQWGRRSEFDMICQEIGMSQEKIDQIYFLFRDIP